MSTFFLLVTLAFTAHAGGADGGAARVQDAIGAVQADGLAASAAEMPPLAGLLSKAGWSATPELSGVFQAGAIIEENGASHSLLAAGCIERVPIESTYTSAEVVSSLQAGVRVGLGVGSIAGEGELVKKIKFATPKQYSIPTMDLLLTAKCEQQFSTLSESQIDRSYVVREALLAVIAEQTCGRISASGRIVGLGAAEAEAAAACSQESFDPVSVGYRTVPLRDLLGRDHGRGAAGAATALNAPPPSTAVGPRALVLASDGNRCTWTIEDVPTGRSKTIFASKSCPSEVYWQGADELLYNDGEQVFSFVAGASAPTLVARPRDDRCDAEEGWGAPHRLADGGLQWSCFSYATDPIEIGSGLVRLCSGEVCADVEPDSWGLGQPVLVKTYVRPVGGAWKLGNLAVDCTETEMCLVRFHEPPPGHVGISLSRLREGARELALHGTAPETVTADPSIVALLGLDDEFSWVEGAALGSARYVLWSRHAETLTAYGPAVVVERNGLQRIALDLPGGSPLTVSSEEGWAVLDPADREHQAVLIGPTGDVPARTWPVGAMVLLLPSSAPPPLGIVP